MAPKKHKLSIAFDEDFGLLGLLSDEPDYKLCWLLNDQIHTDFNKVDDISIYQRKLEEEQLHSLFLYEDENSMLTYRLIGNRSESGYFLPELKNIDYLLHLQGELSTFNLQQLIDKINSLKSVRMCVPVDLNKLVHRDRLHIW